MANYNSKNVRDHVPSSSSAAVAAGPSSRPSTLSKSSTSSLAVNQLIEFSKKLSEVNQLKCESELILEQLTFFQNFIQICDERDPFKMGRYKGLLDESEFSGGESTEPCTTNSLIQSYFEFKVRVLPSSDSTLSSPLNKPCAGGGSSETIILTIENKTDSFSFHHKFWYFSLDFSQGQQVTMWTLDSTLKPGDIEMFSTNFNPQPDFQPEHIKIHVAFTLQFKNQNYMRVFKVGNLFVDVLYLLSPVKRPPSSINTGLQHGPPYFTAFDPLLNDDSKKLPTISKFNLILNSNLDKIFIASVFLDDSNIPRGFTPEMQVDCYTKLVASEEFVVFVENEKIIISRSVSDETATVGGGLGPNNSNNNNNNPNNSTTTTSDKNTFFTWTIRCYNPALLFSLKVGILKRLLALENLNILSPNDSHCEKLYNAKLHLESIQDAVLNDYLEFYIILRDISEQIRYCL